MSSRPAARAAVFFCAVLGVAARPARGVGIIDTIAGGGSGEGLPALAQAIEPNGVRHDGAGNLYVAEGSKHRIRRIDAATGTVMTVAGRGGNGTCGTDVGDGGPATAACLAYPYRIVFDATGNLLVADSGNGRIRRVDASTGIITTVAGGGSAPCPDGGAAVGCRLGPFAIALDAAGNVYLNDASRVRRIDAASGNITTVGSFPGTPTGLAFDPAGNLFVSVVDAARIYRVASDTGPITFFAGNGTNGFCGDGGLASAACLYAPIDVVSDAAGNLLVADRYNYRIRRIDAGSGIITTIAGTGQPLYQCPHDLGDGGAATGACVGDPYGVDVEADGDVLVADLGTNRLRRIDAATGTITTIGGNGDTDVCGDGSAATNACLDTPYAVARDADGNLFIADTNNNRVRRVDATTGIITTVAGNGGDLFGCGPGLGDGGPALDACLQQPVGVALDPAGNLLIADLFNGRVRRVDATTGIISTLAGGGSGPSCAEDGPATDACIAPRGLAVDVAGNVYVTDGGTRVRRIDPITGDVATVAGNGSNAVCGDGGPAKHACLGLADDVAVDSAGNVLIADLNGRVRRVDATTGIITTIAGGGPGACTEGGPATADCFQAALGVTADVLGNVFIAAIVNPLTEAARVFRVDATTGTITTVAGSGAFGFCGDGGPALDACLETVDLVVDLDGSLLLNDAGNNRIRRVTCGGPDSDGDGVCDEYDFGELAGLTVRSAEIEERGSIRRSGIARYHADVPAAAFAPLAGAQAFFAQARQTGFTARLFVDGGPPALANIASLRFPPDRCRFAPDTAAVPSRVRCRLRGRGGGKLDLRQTETPGLFDMRGYIRSPVLRVPDRAELRVAFTLNDPARLDYGAIVDGCAVNESPRKTLSCGTAP